MTKLKNDLIYDNPDESLLQLSLPGTELYSLSGEKLEDKINLELPASLDIQEFDLFGFSSVHGVLCLVESAYMLSQRIVLWKPTASGKIRIVHPSAEMSHRIKSTFHDYEYPDFKVHGFGYDRVKRDYNVIRHVKIVEYSYVSTVWEIYSLQKNCWKKLDFYMPVSYSSHPDCHVYSEGMCHWLSDLRGLCLVSFVLNKEVYGITPIPYTGGTLDLDAYWLQLILLKRSITLLSHRKYTTTFQISILGELGVQESWTKLFTIEMRPSVMRPIGNAEIFFIIGDNKLTWWEYLIKHIFGELEEDQEHNPLLYCEKSLIASPMEH
ncbi:F-box protein CPR1-like [Vicia villosa]|uniref:F-box protein CPR1-like n=1 Tax=Vicia villosa TaxID=3911 RepID=UPI00273B19AD|nr:F-box protein CPR1-like [Vicia villosa]